MCSLTTNDEFKRFTVEDKQYKEDVTRRLFYEPLGRDVGDYFVSTITKAIYG